MDDYNVNVLSEAKNEYSSRLLNILSPLVIQGVRSIYNEAVSLCNDNDESEKYLMTFQNFLSRVPKWSNSIVEEETNRIIDESKCNYLEDLLTCVHITQVKILTSIRVSNHQKKIDIDIPKLSNFIHNVYTTFARKLYSNIYLFEKDIMPLEIQKNMRECEILCRESILQVIRDSMPIEYILRAYMDETVHDEIIEETLEKEVTEGEAEDMLEEAKKNLEKQTEPGIDGVTVNKEEDKAIDDETTQVENVELVSNKDVSSNIVVENDATESTAAESTAAESTAAESTAVTAETNEKELEATSAIENSLESAAIAEVKQAIEADKKKFEKIKENISSIETKPLTVDTAAGPSRSSTPTPTSSTNSNVSKSVIKFNDNDSVLDMGTNKQSIISAPKTIERLEEISHLAAEKERASYDDDDFDDEEEDSLKIHDDNISLTEFDFQDLTPKPKINNDNIILDDIEVLA